MFLFFAHLISIVRVCALGGISLTFFVFGDRPERTHIAHFNINVVRARVNAQHRTIAHTLNAHMHSLTRSIVNIRYVGQMHVNAHTHTSTQCHLWLRKFNIFDVSLLSMSLSVFLVTCMPAMLPYGVLFAVWMHVCECLCVCSESDRVRMFCPCTF